MTTKTLALILSLALFLFVLELVRRERLSFKYALGWLSISLLALFLSVFDSLLNRLAFTLGFEIPSNFIFFAALAGITFLSLLLTIFLCQQNVRNDKIAQRLGLIESKLEFLAKGQGKPGEAER